MKNGNNKLCNKIRSVKSWLSKAEDSFGNENELQGELNLLLAEAEMQHLRETEARDRRRRRHVISMGVALVIVAGFFCLWKIYPIKANTAGAKNEKAKTTVVESALPDVKEPLPVTAKGQEDVNFKAVVEEMPIKTNTAQNQNNVVKSKGNFDDNEMKHLVRTAGKVLRSST